MFLTPGRAPSRCTAMPLTLPMDFEFATATRILFGRGKLRELGGVTRLLGRRALIVTGRSLKRAEPVQQILADQQLSSTIFQVEGEPTVTDIREGAQLGKQEQCDLVIGVGGGSALDAGK